MADVNDRKTKTTEAQAASSGRASDETGAQQRTAEDVHFAGLSRALVEGLAQADRGELLQGSDVVAEVRDSLTKRRGTRNHGE